MLAEYKHGFVSDVDSEVLPAGLSETVVRTISSMKDEPTWLLEFRLNAYNHLQSLSQHEGFEPKFVNLPKVDLQALTYFARPRKRGSRVDPELLRTFKRLGVPIGEQDRLAGVAIDAVFDSQSVLTTTHTELEQLGIVFCSLSKAVKDYPQLVQRYLGSVVPAKDNFYACLNAAVFSDGSFVYVPPGITCPLDLSTYFRINTAGLGQFERTLIIADNHARVSYLEGCTAPARPEQPLHAAVVELIALNSAEIRYSTAQNWYAGDHANGLGGVLNYVTKRGHCKGDNSKIFWTQVETGSAVTWKYPSCILSGVNSHGEFHSVSVTAGRQQADTGTKMIHLGSGSTSKIIAKGISADSSVNVYRGIVRMGPHAVSCRNYSSCDSLILGENCVAATVPLLDSGCAGSNSIEHEASTGRLSQEQMLMLESRGLSQAEAVSLILEGFCRDVISLLPLEFAQEAAKLLSLKLEGCVG